jgi:TPR repeat protein
MDLNGAAHYFKLSADQGDTAGQYWHGQCMLDGDGVSTELQLPEPFFAWQSGDNSSHY